jgi:hypothetical protein
MRRSAIACVAVLVSALALALSACGADDEGRLPITTVQNTTAQTDENEQTGGDADLREHDEENDSGGKEKGKDRGKGHGNGKGGDSE